jgi:hypothetical protein
MSFVVDRFKMRATLTVDGNAFSTERGGLNGDGKLKNR